MLDYISYHLDPLEIGFLAVIVILVLGMLLYKNDENDPFNQ